MKFKVLIGLVFLALCVLALGRIVVLAARDAASGLRERPLRPAVS